ncbi:MAG: hypothetical protein JWN37_80 [Candidatus Nomurabacteria bacterium]|nr:hypothetical protein [Candidatus Nomurabacteria bacterium]
MNGKKEVLFSWNLLKWAYGLVVLLAGLDKIFGTNLIVSWPKYVSPLAESMLPFSVGTFLVIIGIVEVVVALLILTKFQKIGAYLATAWLLIIAINLLMLGYIDIAIRDVLLAVGAVVLATLTDGLKELGIAK